MTKEMKPLLLPKFAWVAERGNQPVGFALGLPDINVILRDLNGRLTRFGFPIGLIKLLFCKKRIRKGRLIALGVIEKYRRAGIAEILVLRVMEETMVKSGGAIATARYSRSQALPCHFSSSESQKSSG